MSNDFDIGIAGRLIEYTHDMYAKLIFWLYILRFEKSRAFLRTLDRKEFLHRYSYRAGPFGVNHSTLHEWFYFHYTLGMKEKALHCLKEEHNIFITGVRAEHTTQKGSKEAGLNLDV